MRTGMMMVTALLISMNTSHSEAQPRRERKLETRILFEPPTYVRDTATVPVVIEIDERVKRFVGLSVQITEVHPIRPNENVRGIIHPYEMPRFDGKPARAEITFHVKRDAKYRIELEMVYEDVKDQLIHRIEKEEIHGERR